MIDWFQFERDEYENGMKIVAGMDEAGRGPLAGPVVVACVIMPPEERFMIAGVNDSKQLSEKKRNELYGKIIQAARAYAVVQIDEQTIDRINILNATKLGMKRCVEALTLKPDVVLIDAVKLDLDMKTKAIVHGDALSYSIACASILAKVTRDKIMTDLDGQYPQYNFKKHKGYGTQEHIANLKKFGMSAIHRKTFIKHFIDVE